MTGPVVLIGPICCGKSTLAPLLAARLGRPHVSLDDLRWAYYDAAGFDHAEAARLVRSHEGTLGVLRYSKPFEAGAVERVVSDHPGAVIDFGAGHSVQDDAVLFERVRLSLTPCEAVVLLLPSPDTDESVRVLNERFAALLRREVGSVDDRLLVLNETYVRHPANDRLATLTVYTGGLTPEQTSAEILRRLRSGG